MTGITLAEAARLAQAYAFQTGRPAYVVKAAGRLHAVTIAGLASLRTAYGDRFEAIVKTF